MIRKENIWIWVMGLVLLLSTGCRKLVGPTHVSVVDNCRHYVPMLQGDILRMYWTLLNEGPEPFVIEEVQPSCSAITLMSELPDVVIPGDSVVMIFDFDTDKNINMTKHYIRVFGNIDPDGVAEMVYDVNIVRGTLENIDYEERFFNRNQADGMRGDRKIRMSEYDVIPTTTVTYAFTFEVNKADLRPESISEIKRIALLMKDNPHISFEVQGHCDSQGTERQNEILSLRRAETIVSALIREGIDPARLRAVGKGSREPVGDNSTAEGRSINRRVVFVKI